MIKGVGVDIVYMTSIKTMLEAQTEESLREIFTEEEILLCRSSPNTVERFATRFAAKEAVMKALGVGWQKDGVDWRDIEVTLDEQDIPVLRLEGEAKTMAVEKGVLRTWLSLSHEQDVAIAMVILEG